jgi:hypothetical protein
MYVPYLKQEEPLKSECQHFLDCIRESISPLTNGRQGLELVRILEASSASLKQGGAPVTLPAAMLRHSIPIKANGGVLNSNGDRHESVVRA